MRHFLLLLALAAAVPSFAQEPLHLDHILLMNGQIIDTRVLGQSTLEVRYLEFRGDPKELNEQELHLIRLVGLSKSNTEIAAELATTEGIVKARRKLLKQKVQLRAEPTENVFSVTDSLGHERIWYFMDTAFGNDLNIEEMRCFLKGEQDAREGYKPRWPVWGGFVVGAGATIAANLEMNSLFLPPLYGAAMILPRVHVTKGSITDLTMEGNEHYAYGYAKVGKSKRIVRSMLSTAAGVVVGLAVRQLIINPSLPGYD